MTRHSRHPRGIFSLALASRGLAPTRIEHEGEPSTSARFSSPTWLLALVLVVGVVALSLLQPLA
jgi:hypothetical protein